MSKLPGRLYVTGAVLFILCGIGHSIGQFTSSGPDPASAEIERTMRSHVIPGTPFTYWNIMQCWGALYGAMTILFGALLLVVRRASQGSPAVRRATAITAVIAALVQTACSFFYNAIPPVFFMIPAALLMLLAATWRERPTA